MPLTLASNAITFTDSTSLSSGIITANQLSAGAVQQSFANTSGALNFRNKIINGNFDIWQRGTSVTGVTDNQFVADRWRSGRVGTTANVSRQSFTVGQTAVPNEPMFFHRIVVSTVSGTGNYCLLAQPIESIRTLAGKTATLSFWAKADAPKNIAVELGQFVGTGGSPTGGNLLPLPICNLTTTWQRFVRTINIPSIANAVLGTDNNDHLGLQFWFDAGSNFNSRTNSLGQQSGTFDIAQVQLEEGTVATPFEQRPTGLELTLCQRYYQRYIHPRMTGVNVASARINRLGMQLPVRMRATPNVTYGPIPVYNGINVSTLNNTIAPAATYHSEDRVEFDVDAAANLGGSLGLVVVTYFSGNNATLDINAEL